MNEKEPTIQVSEIFHTIQGEGPMIGRPCVFLRLHNCPVHCPQCDTAFTWNGTEKGKPATHEMIRNNLIMLAAGQKVGLVLSGGEPLLHYRNEFLMREVLSSRWQWSTLETSGYAGEIGGISLGSFLACFTSISLSPKITPCLHGRQSDEELETNIPLFLSISQTRLEKKTIFFKFVVRDEKDIEAILRCNDRHKFMPGWDTYLMPYGNQREEILKTIETLIPAASKYGFIITPRLHSLLWGSQRGK
jgi:7-carboxy-7-deazaguanine synthase